MLPSFETELIWTDGSLVLKNAPDAVLKHLHYQHKALVQDPDKPYNRKVVKEKVELYRVVEPGIVTTFQGLKQRVEDLCRKAGVSYQLVDRRKKLPPPDLTKTGNFRFSQKLLFLMTVGANQSGICKAPTRYGKTLLMVNVLRAYAGLKTVVTAPGVSLLMQLEKDLKYWLPGRDIRGIYTGSRNKKVSSDITLVSMDSLEKAEPETIQLVLVDEPHSAAAPSRIQSMMQFSNARILGFGATITGRFDGADRLVEGIIGPVLAERTYTEAVAEGAICPITVFMVQLPFNIWPCGKRDTAYRHLLYRNKQFNKLVQQLLSEVVPADWQTVVFIDEIKQADLMQQLVQEGVIAVAKRMNRETRAQIQEDMVNNVIKRCIATDIFATGLTFPDLRVLVNAAGGGGAITSTQKPGRLAQMRPGKKAGYLIDFMFVPTGDAPVGANKEYEAVVRDCWARVNSYKKTGFDVRFVNQVSEIQLL